MHHYACWAMATSGRHDMCQAMHAPDDHRPALYPANVKRALIVTSASPTQLKRSSDAGIVACSSICGIGFLIGINICKAAAGTAESIGMSFVAAEQDELSFAQGGEFPIVVSPGFQSYNSISFAGATSRTFNRKARQVFAPATRKAVPSRQGFSNSSCNRRSRWSEGKVLTACGRPETTSPRIRCRKFGHLSAFAANLPLSVTQTCDIRHY